MKEKGLQLRFNLFCILIFLFFSNFLKTHRVGMATGTNSTAEGESAGLRGGSA